ncbi:aryl-alcohol dehydrogenase [Colletotrichum asianum]|uniref:Aryl-alcohol dehydrogenase n=1 Tax=Colletotrichum asianum TaxID=702518 RepID=A0A8H3ZMY4_9PEZI|nr:aryl-alcohol dehydrogenase [Colletotrichum asianum]
MLNPTELSASSSANPPTKLELDLIPYQLEMKDPADDWTGVSSRRRKLKELCNNLESGEGEGESSSSLDGDRGYVLLPCPNRRAEMIILTKSAQTNYSLGTPQPTQLYALVGLNLLNALARNARVLGFIPQSLCEDHFISPFNLEGPKLPCGPRQASLWPPFLRPTEAQYQITHNPFLDLFPISSLRESAIRAEDLGFFDEDEFCADVFGVGHKSNDGDERPRLLVWGESWDPRGWEANEAFFRKWAWLVRGCPEILEGTNYWRQRRGEKKLNFGRLRS